MTQELKPCPFCGGEGQPALLHAGGLEWAQVECVEQSCGAIGPTPASEAEAITAWNTRAPTSPVEAAADDLLAVAQDAIDILDVAIDNWNLIFPDEADEVFTDLQSRFRAAIAKATGQQVAA